MEGLGGGWARGWGPRPGVGSREDLVLNIGNMGAVLVEEAGGNSMGQLGRPSVDEGSWRRRGCLSGFRVRED